jgi:hypothetical protein
VFTAILSAYAIGFELITRVCAIFFDPLADAWCIAAYSFLIVMLLVNEHVLKIADAVSQDDGIVRKLNMAMAGTYGAVAIASVYSILFVPALPLSLFALMYFGCGAGAWSPFINLVVLICQMRALAEHRKFRQLGPLISIRAATACLSILVCVGGLIAFAPREQLSVIAHHAPGHRMFSSWWGYVHGISYNDGHPGDWD